MSEERDGELLEKAKEGGVIIVEVDFAELKTTLYNGTWVEFVVDESWTGDDVTFRISRKFLKRLEGER